MARLSSTWRTSFTGGCDALLDLFVDIELDAVALLLWLGIPGGRRRVDAEPWGRCHGMRPMRK